MGDGVKANFFDNEFFTGEFRTEVAGQINYSWYLESPVAGINSENFSLMFEKPKLP